MSFTQKLTFNQWIMKTIPYDEFISCERCIK